MSRSKPFPAKRIGRLFMLIALLFFAGAAWVLVSRTAIFFTWPSANASVIAAGVDQFAGSDGALLFRTKLNVSFQVDGKEIFAEAFSVTSTPLFADAIRQARKFEPGSVHQVRYNSRNPKEAKADARISWSYLGSAPLLFAVGCAIAVMGVLIYRSHKQPIFCSQCNGPLEHHFKFCPKCASPVSEPRASASGSSVSEPRP